MLQCLAKCERCRVCLFQSLCPRLRLTKVDRTCINIVLSIYCANGCVGAEHYHDFCIQIFRCKVTDLTLAGRGILRKTLKDSVKLFLRHQDILVSSTDIFLIGFGLPFVFRAEPTVFCRMICATTVCAYLVRRRLWLGRWLFVFGLVPIAFF